MDEGRDPVLDRLVGFTRALRDAGLTIGGRRTLAYIEGVSALGSPTLEHLYWAGRLTLLGRRREIPIYDRVFDAWFRGARREDVAAQRQARVRLIVEGDLPAGRFRMPEGRVREVEGPARKLAFTAASPAEVLRRKSFEDYTPEDAEQARALIQRLARREPRRRSRRTRPSGRRGLRPDLARTLREALRTQGEPLERTWRRRRTRPRRLVLVLDVSGSMGAYARSLARFAHAAVQAGRRHVEVFAFGTRLTRITPSLHSRDPRAALTALADAVQDWEGGTRIGECLKELIDDWGRRGPLRGAVVVILSDGLERGDPMLLADQMARLSRLAHRIVWANPLKGSPEYAPLARGMAAALPHIDAFLPGHNLASLESLAEVIERFGAG